MTSIPITRNLLHNIKIYDFINKIYNNVLKIAKERKETVYYHSIPTESNSHYSDQYYIKNMNLIIYYLQTLFPDLSIKHAICAMGKDGQIYDISNVNKIELSSINEMCYNSYIIIDWSLTSDTIDV